MTNMLMSDTEGNWTLVGGIDWGYGHSRCDGPRIGSRDAVEGGVAVEYESTIHDTFESRLVGAVEEIKRLRAELAALRPLKAIAEAAIVWHSTPYDEGAVHIDYADGVLGDVIKAYLAAQEGGEK